MKYQKTGYTCGPASVSNALRFFVISLNEDEVKKFIKTTKQDGTDDPQMIAGLKEMGFSAKKYKTRKAGEAYKDLYEFLENNPCVLSVDDDEHYVAAIGLAGGRCIIVDSDKDDKENKRENGIFIMSEEELLKRWKNKKGEFSGLIIYKKFLES